MASIGSISCTRVTGHCPRPKQRVVLWNVPGVDGVGAQRMGLGDAQFEVTAVLFSSAAGIEAWKVALESLQGTIVAIVNDLGATYTNCLVVQISQMESRAARAGGGITQRGEIVVSGVSL